MSKKFWIVLVFCWVTLAIAAWDKDKPAASTSLRTSNPQILANSSALETAIGQDHEFSTGGTNSGEHTQVKFNAPVSTPTNAANKLFLYGKDVGGVIELHVLDESGNEIQLTSAGGLFSSTSLAVTTTLTVTGESTFNNHVNLGAGDDLLGSTTSDIDIGSGNFTVAGATGDTVVAGTLGVTGIATLGDTSALASSAAPGADAQIANKKYVDDQITAHVLGTPTNLDSDTNALIADAVYLVTSDGFITANITSSDYIQGKVGETSSPSTIVAKDGHSSDSASFGSITFPVKSGWYWTVDGDTAQGVFTAYWHPLGSGECQKQ